MYMKCVVFGIGKEYEKDKEYIDDEVVGYIDNYKVGSKMPDGKIVRPVSDLSYLEFDRIIISSFDYRNDMLQQIEALDKTLLYKTIFLQEYDKRNRFCEMTKGSINIAEPDDKKLSLRAYYIVIPWQSVSGGPELLHQFAYNLKKILPDKDVIIAYYSKNKKNEFNKFDYRNVIPTAYRKYITDCKVIDFNEIVDNEENIVVLPEVLVDLAFEFKKIRIHLWWLSVDNFFNSLEINNVPRLFSRVDLHLYQSEYARCFLDMIGIPQTMTYDLDDYINEFYLDGVDFKKDDIIVYNPKKGYNFTKALLSDLNMFTFVPIENMNSLQVKELLSRSKVYIDFGNHPGKDRLPREAALMNCCVICGKRGSANNDIDVPIDYRYKIDMSLDGWWETAKMAITDCIKNYDENINRFSDYRRKILNEERDFINKVRKLAELIVG